MTQNTPLATFNVIKGWLFYTEGRKKPYFRQFEKPAPISEFFKIINNTTKTLPNNEYEMTGFMIRPLLVEQE